MHELFTKVLSRKDLSRAGDLFSVADAEIVIDLSDVVRIYGCFRKKERRISKRTQTHLFHFNSIFQIDAIDSIISQSDYLKNTNDQSVVEICVTRVLSCIRETKTAEQYCASLVILLEKCLQYNLQPTVANKDSPHAKIAADIISSIFLVSFPSIHASGLFLNQFIQRTLVAKTNSFGLSFVFIYSQFYAHPSVLLSAHPYRITINKR